MDRFFNTEGPCEPSRHYMLPALDRLPTIHKLIERGKYLVLHAPRQVGKTTALLTLARELTDSGRYAAAVLTMELGAPFGGELRDGLAERAILASFREAALDRLPATLQPPPWPEASEGSLLQGALSAWSRACPRPLVIFIDEIDALRGPLLLSALRQLRARYADRPGGFPWSIALCGMRDVRDYHLEENDPEEAQAHSSSPFNVKESLTMRLFTEGEVAALYQQHTAATGQRFTAAAVARAFALSGGHPWLVNAIGAQLMDAIVVDRRIPITVDHVEQAKEDIILKRETHLDSLVERLREPRVRRVIEPILIGAEPRLDSANDDLVYVRDLGLIVDRPQVRIANEIYQEIIPRALSYMMQVSLTQEAAWYRRSDGSLDMVLLLAAFQEFFAAHSEAWLGRFDYQEAGPHLLLMAFLQRIVNGGGRITREFAVGSGRADLVVEYGGRRAVLELKLYRGPDTEREGVSQLCQYLDRLGEPEGHLLVFDRRKTRSWADKIDIKEVAGPSGQRIYVFGA